MENVVDMVGTREAAVVATESCGGGVATTGDKTAATSGVIYMDEGELELDEDEMAALEGQCLVAEFFPDPGLSRTSKASMRVSRQEISVVETTVDRKHSTESDDDEGVTGCLSDAAAAVAYQTNPNLPDFIHPHGLLIYASGSSAYEIFCSLFPDELLALLVEETNRYYGQTVAALDGLDNLPPTSRLQD